MDVAGGLLRFNQVSAPVWGNNSDLSGDMATVGPAMAAPSSPRIGSKIRGKRRRGKRREKTTMATCKWFDQGG